MQRAKSDKLNKGDMKDTELIRNLRNYTDVHRKRKDEHIEVTSVPPVQYFGIGCITTMQL